MPLHCGRQLTSVNPKVIVSRDLYQRPQKPAPTTRRTRAAARTPPLAASSTHISGWAKATSAQYSRMDASLQGSTDDETSVHGCCAGVYSPLYPLVPVSPDLIAAVIALTHGRANAILSKCDTEALPTPDPSSLGHAFATGDVDLDGTALRYKKLANPSHPDHLKWQAAHHNELVKLVDVRKSMHFIHAHDKPVGAPVTYYNPRCKRKNIDDPNGNWTARVRGTVGGDKCEYTGDRTAHTAGMTTVKILLNHVISDEDSVFATADVDDYYLMTGNLETPVYMRMQLADIPPQSMEHFGLTQYIRPTDTSVLVRVTGGIYGLPEAGRLAQQKLLPHLASHGYTECRDTPMLFRHDTRKTSFVLVVDDLGIKYQKSKPEDLEHLFTCLRELYSIKTNLGGDKFLGLSIRWNYTPVYKDSTCEVSIPNYYTDAAKRFGITCDSNVFTPEVCPDRNYHSPSSQQITFDDSPPLDAAGVKTLQGIVGVMLYAARAVDGMKLLPCSHLSSAQSKPTQTDLDAAYTLLRNAATFPNPTLVFRPSDMILRIIGDASYNSEPGARSRAGVFYHLGMATDDTFINGPILCLSSLIPTIVCSASEAEYATVYIAGKEGLPIRYTLDNIDCIQPATPITCDNTTAVKIIDGTCKLKRSRSIDQRYHWIRERVNEFKDFTCPGNPVLVLYSPSPISLLSPTPQITHWPCAGSSSRLNYPPSLQRGHAARLLAVLLYLFNLILCQGVLSYCILTSYIKPITRIYYPQDTCR